MVNFNLPDPQAPVAIMHAAAGSSRAVLRLMVFCYLVVLPAVLVFTPDVIMWVLTRWEARHGNH